MNYWWDRKTLKLRAKNTLKTKYWWTLLALIIVGILGSDGGSSISSSFSSYYNNNNSLSNYSMGGEYYNTVLSVATAIALVLLAIGFLYSTFIGNVISVGGYRFLCANTVEHNKPSLSHLFFGFKQGNYMNIVKAMFMRNLFVFLWSLLFVIPGIIKGYSYYMIPYIMAENPRISWQRAFEISKVTTRGEKWKIFVLGFSFIGWMFLASSFLCLALLPSHIFGLIIGLILYGLSMFALTPYIRATHAELYGALRFKAAKCGYCSKDEIASEHFDF